MGIGIDIASMDGNSPDVTTLKDKAGCTFAILRAAYGTYQDKTYLQYRMAFQAKGIPVGAYIFPQYPRPNQPAPAPKVQAESIAKTVGPKLGALDLPVSVDIEFNTDVKQETGLSPQEMVMWIDELIQTLRQIYGYMPMIYTSARVMAEPMHGIATPMWVDCPLWVKGIGGTKYLSPYMVNVRQAAILKPNLTVPPNTPPSWEGCWHIQQFQGDALYVPGMQGTTDLNKWNLLRLGATGGTVKWIQRKLGLVANGVWEDTTNKAMVAFQQANGLDADGWFGPKTYIKLCQFPRDPVARASGVCK